MLQPRKRLMPPLRTVQPRKKHLKPQGLLRRRLMVMTLLLPKRLVPPPVPRLKRL